MNREFIDFLEQDSPLDIMHYTKLGLRFIYRKEISEIEKGLRDIENGKNISRQIKSFQEKKLIELCKFAYENNDYYKEIFQKANLDLNSLRNFNKIPTLDRKTIREFGDRLTVRKLKPWQNYEIHTGGSTGEPLRVLLSPKCGIIDDIHQEFLYRLIGYRDGDGFITFGGTEVPSELIENNIFWIDKNSKRPFGKKKYSAFYLSDKNIPLYLANFIKTKPDLILSYPSVIYEIARYMNREHIRITFKIKGIILTAERAFDWQIREIRKAFRAKIYFEYGHSEVCVFAYTPANSRKYLCSPFYGFTEVLDDQDKQVKKGSAGEVVVTSFYNYAMPLIRYRTGDIAIYGGIKKGVVCLDKVQGRSQDYIYGADGNKVALNALIFGQHYRAFRNIKKWQIIQSRKGSVVIKIVPDKYFGQKDKLEIRKKFLDLANTKAVFKYLNSIPLSKRGKFLLLIQKIKT